MPLYDRLLGRTDAGAQAANKIPVHQFVCILNEVARGARTGGEALTLVSRCAGVALTSPEQTEANTLLTTITSLGTGTLKLARAQEINDVLTLAEQLPGPWPGGSGAATYDRPADVKTRLGV